MRFPEGHQSEAKKMDAIKGSAGTSLCLFSIQLQPEKNEVNYSALYAHKAFPLALKDPSFVTCNRSGNLCHHEIRLLHNDFQFLGHSYN